jgi:hypothetical protein
MRSTTIIGVGTYGASDWARTSDAAALAAKNDLRLKPLRFKVDADVIALMALHLDVQFRGAGIHYLWQLHFNEIKADVPGSEDGARDFKRLPVQVNRYRSDHRGTAL